MTEEDVRNVGQNPLVPAKAGTQFQQSHGFPLSRE